MPIHGNYPLPLSVEIHRAGTPMVDRFGNQKPVLSQWVRVKVFGWSINPTSEGNQTSILRTYDQLTVYMPTETAPKPSERIRLPNGSIWEVEGHPENYNHNPWYEPGLVVVQCKKVEG